MRPETPTFSLEPPGRSRRIVATFLVGATALIGVTTWLTIELTTRAVTERIESELSNTSRQIGAPGFPLTDPALGQIAGFLHADVVTTDASGAIVATSLPPELHASFESARAALPASAERARVHRAERGDGSAYTLGVAPVPPNATLGAGGVVYLLYRGDLVAEQARQTWRPLAAVAVVAALLALLLGAFSERNVQRARTEALLQLLVSVAHEIRNPLGAITTLARSLKPRLGDGVDPAPLEVIAAEAERLSLLVDGLRAVGLPVRTIRRSSPPDEAAAAVLTLVAHQLQHRRVAVEQALRAPEARILADPAQVRQVILNLVLNAADAQPSGGRVVLESGVVDERWELSVSDDGPGVAPEVLEQLFQPFVTTKPKGLGVGLYLSRRLVDAHGGELICDRDAARGARFVLRWPLAPPEPAPVTEAASA